MNICEFLSGIPPFSDIESDALTVLSVCARIQVFQPDEQIIYAGEYGDALYVIFEGEVQVCISEREGARHVAWLGPREMFGEMALITGDVRQADVFASTETICVVIDKDPLYELLREDSSVAMFLTELVGQRLVSGHQITQVGKYQVLHELGRGGMAIVYAGYHPQLRRSVAIKMLKHAYVFDHEFAEQFAAEASVVARLEHSNIVEVYDHEVAYGTQFIVMEMVNGLTLTERMAADPQMDEGVVRRIIVQLADALHYAHEAGIVHRDVKPDNVMLVPGEPLRLMDFGIAHRPADGDATVVGTPAYMAPEQGERGPQDGRVDIYALGVIAFEMLTDTLPVVGEDDLDTIARKATDPIPDVRTLRPNISDQMISFIEKACQADPEARFQSALEIKRHFGVGEPLVRPGVRARTVTLLYPSAEEGAVRNAIDQLSATLAERDVLISAARHTQLTQ
ncbi:MAG: protein kinase domain-containing protein [Bradymonadia bacterium]